MNESFRLHVGFGRQSLWRSWQTSHALADEVDVRAMVVRSGGCTAALAVADIGVLWPSLALRCRQAIASALKIPPENVGIFTTQNHAAPSLGEFPWLNVPAFEAGFVKAADDAHARLEEAQVGLVVARPTRPLVFCRRVQWKGMTFTFWYGHRIDPETGQADVSHLLRAALGDMAKGVPSQLHCITLLEDGSIPTIAAVPGAPDLGTSVYLPPAADDLVQALLFRNPAGKPIGSLIRFAAHPATSNVRGSNVDSGDYPVYARRRMEEGFGGMSLFVTGPCGDQVPPLSRKSAALGHDVGRRVADCILGAMNTARWRDGGPVAVISPPVNLTIRADMPASNEQAAEEGLDVERQLQLGIREGWPVEKIKQLTERYEVLGYVAHDDYFAWTGLKPAGLCGRQISHPLFVLRIGEAVLAGLPGEPFGAYSVRLRDMTVGDSLIVAEEANGYLSYFPTAEECPRGSYEPCAGMFTPQAQETLVNGAAVGIRQLMAAR